MNKEEIAEVEGRGHQAVEKAIDQKLDPSHKNLLWLQKDAFNSFTSNYQLLHDSTLGSYAVIQEVMKELIIQTYLQQGIKHSTTSRKVKIDGNTFNLLEVKLFSPDGKKLIMSQHIYDGLIDPNTMLLINTNFNNAKDKAVLTRIVKSSTFRKRP